MYSGLKITLVIILIVVIIICLTRITIEDNRKLTKELIEKIKHEEIASLKFNISVLSAEIHTLGEIVKKLEGGVIQRKLIKNHSAQKEKENVKV